MTRSWPLRVSVLLLAAAFALASREARAQGLHEDSPFGPPPEGALELALATGYARGLGATGSPRMTSIDGDGFAGRASAGFRLDARWAVALALDLQLSAQRDAGGLGGAALATWHLAPTATVDPWLEPSVGVRRLWEDAPGGVTLHATAFDLPRLVLGADLKVSELVSVAPVVGSALTVYTGDGTRVGSFFFAGVQGRLDVFSGVGD